MAICCLNRFQADFRIRPLTKQIANKPIKWWLVAPAVKPPNHHNSATTGPQGSNSSFPTQQKSVLICPSCDREELATGNWIVTTPSDENCTIIVCPTCETQLATQGLVDENSRTETETSTPENVATGMSYLVFAAWLEATTIYFDIWSRMWSQALVRRRTGMGAHQLAR